MTSPRAGTNEDRPRFTGTQRGALAVIASAVGLDASSVAVVNAALPQIERQLAMTEGVLQWVITAYAVTFAGFLLFGGRLADVFARRRVFVAGIAIFAAGSLAAAFASGTVWLILARAVQGVGGAISVPASTALLFEIFAPGPVRNKALGIFTSVAAGSFSGGLIFGGFLADLFGWRSVFVFTAAVGGVILLGARATLPAGTSDRRPLDLPGTMAVTVGLLLAIYGLNRAGEQGWSDAVTVAPLVAGAALLGGFVWWERRTSESLLPLDLLKIIPVWSAAVTAFVFFGIVLAELFFTPLYMQNMLGYSPMTSAAALLAQSLAVIVSANVTARMLNRGVGQHALMATGMLLLAAGLASFVRTPLDGSYLVHLLPGFVVVGLGIGMCHASMTAASLTGIPRDEQGVAGAFNATAQQVGASMGTVVLVAIAVATPTGDDGLAGELAGYHAAYWGAAVLGLVGACTVLVLGALNSRATRTVEPVPARVRSR